MDICAEDRGDSWSCCLPHFSPSGPRDHGTSSSKQLYTQFQETVTQGATGSQTQAEANTGMENLHPSV